jgi:class 3 adenylate cyclase
MTTAIVAFENNTFDPSLLMRYKRRQDDLGLLARSFNQMATSIQEAVKARDEFIRSASRFVPTQYLDFLGKDNINQIRLGDHVAAEMAVMFSDVRGFTTMSESMTPKQNFDFVNVYLRLVSPIIQRHNGFIVKFLGDGMMAVFPYGVDDAVRAGIEKQQNVKIFNAELAKRGFPLIKVGIGIHTGHMMVGMIGEEMRLQGDAFSDNVNLTSRVEGLTKFYGVSMIITEETRMRLERPIPYRMRYMGKAQVKGRETPIGLYDVFDGDPDEEATAKTDTLDLFEKGLRAYMAGRLSEAQQSFEVVLAQNPNDKTATFFLRQARDWQTRALPQNWEGVEVMDAK